MKFVDALEKRIIEAGNPICMGMDPVLKRIPVEATSIENKVETFYMKLLEQMDKTGIYPAAVKPNSAYYECLSVSSMAVLERLILEYKKRGILIVLDAKRGDIGKSSAAYATAAFDIYHADCVTVSPYMGEDCVTPFLTDETKGVYGLLRTSNRGAADFQDLICDELPLFKQVGKKFINWSNDNLGAVVGATHLEEMVEITQFFIEQGKEIPFLIPGVSVPGVGGQQGGTASGVIKALLEGGSKRNFHLLNSSSGLNYAYEAFTNLSYPEAMSKALDQLITDCN